MITRRTTITSTTIHHGNGLLELLVTVKTVGDEAEVPVATSEATTLYDPAPTFGTANAQSKAPWALVVIVEPLYEPTVHDVGVWATESNETLTAEPTEKPDPLTVYVPPEPAEVGVVVIAGAVMPNVAAALSNVPSAPVRVSV